MIYDHLQIMLFFIMLRLILICLAFANFFSVSISQSASRSKRFLWITHDRRLIFPPGTVLDLKPTLQIPFLRKEEPPDGIHSDIQISWFFYIIFNELGLTHEIHPWPPFYPVGSLFGPSRRKRSSRTILSLPSPSSFPGGERAFIYPKLERLASSMGWQGRPCLLRLVCETHEYPLKYGYGLLGELFTLFFTVSLSDFAQSHLPTYLNAEEMGRAGNCSKYFEMCDKSLFKWEKKSPVFPKSNNDADQMHLPKAEKKLKRMIFM